MPGINRLWLEYSGCGWNKLAVAGITALERWVGRNNNVQVGGTSHWSKWNRGWTENWNYGGLQTRGATDVVEP